MLDAVIDIVTVAHTDHYVELAEQLRQAIHEHHPDDAHWTFTVVDQRVINRGFAGGCNIGAADGAGTIVGLINPDLRVCGPFFHQVRAEMLGFVGADITGCSFGKSPDDYQAIWGCDTWVCGACMFITRNWWETMGGFDAQYVWGWEETDLIRRTQTAGGTVTAIDLPVEHDSPTDDPERITQFKTYHFNEGAQRFYRKWPIRRRTA